MKKRRNDHASTSEAARPGMDAFLEETTGFVGESLAVCREGCHGGKAESATSAPAGWLSPGLIRRAHKVWSKRYGRSLERGEVLEILHNLRWFGELMRRALPGGTV